MTERPNPDLGMPENVTDGTWTFYDAWAAFPGNRDLEDRDDVVGLFVVSLDDPTGPGLTHGEFTIRFYDFPGTQSETAHLEVFGDAWPVLAASGLVEHLASLERTGRREVYEQLVSLGVQDRTSTLRGQKPAICPSCGGTGQQNVDRPYLPGESA